MFCRNCGKELIGTPEICPGCGAKPLAANSFCQNCGAATDPKAEVCVKCGVRLAHPKAKKKVSPKSLLAATLLCFFLGQFGAHRFYIGKIGTAVVMLILGILGYATIWLYFVGFIFLLPVWLWALIDFIILVTGNMKDSEGKPIKEWQT